MGNLIKSYNVNIFNASNFLFGIGNDGIYLIRDISDPNKFKKWQEVSKEDFITLGTKEHGEKFRQWVEKETV